MRVTLTLALAFGVLAYQFGFASILGAFASGLLVRATDLTGPHPHPQFELKLQGIGFGFLIPIFFIATGIKFDLRALVSHPSALVEVPVFLLALLVVRGLPAVAFVRMVRPPPRGRGGPDGGQPPPPPSSLSPPRSVWPPASSPPRPAPPCWRPAAVRGHLPHRGPAPAGPAPAPPSPSPSPPSPSPPRPTRPQAEPAQDIPENSQAPAIVMTGASFRHFTGVDDGIRTHGPQDHNLVL